MVLEALINLSKLHQELTKKSMSEKITWTAEAQAKLKDIPFFVRPFAFKKIEKYAQDNNFQQITLEVYEQAKKQFNKKYNEMK